MADSVRRVLVEYGAVATGLTRTTTQARRTLSRFASDAGKSGKATGAEYSKGVTGGLGNIAKRVAAPLAGLFALDKVKDFAKGAYDEAREAQKVGAQTNAVIKSTGGAANVSAKAVGKLATAISNKTGIDDEQIQTGQNMLLTFTNIRNGVGKNNKIFDLATKATTDMAVATGQDMRGAALQLGKALNDPEKGMTRLQRVGVTFTDQQKKQVAALVKSGNTMGAQKIILHELQKEFGGSAAAQATAGEKLTTTWKNFQEEIGTKALPVIDKLFNFLATKGIPAIDTMINRVGAGIKWFRKWQGVILPIAATVGVLVAGMTAIGIAQKIMMAGGLIKWFLQLGKVEKVAAGVQWALNAAMDANPIGLIVIGLAALVVGLVVAYKKSETFRKIVNAAWAGIKATAVAVFHWFTGSFVPFFTKTLPGVFKSSVNWIKHAWSAVWKVITAPFHQAKAGVSAGWAAITGTFTKSKNWVGSTWRRGWSGVKHWIGDAVSGGQNVTSDALTRTRGAFSKLQSWGSGAFKRGWANMKYNLTHPIDFAKTVISKLLGRTGLQKVFAGAVSNVKRIWQGLQDAVKAPVRFVVNTVLNGGLIAGYNKLASFAWGNDSHNIAPIGLPKGFERGGYTGAGPRKKPAGLVHMGEVVWDQDAVSKAGGPGIVDGWRRMIKSGIMPGFDGGGIVGKITGAAGSVAGWVKSTIGNIGKAIQDPKRILEQVILKALTVGAGIMRSPFGQTISRLPGRLVGGLVNKVTGGIGSIIGHLPAGLSGGTSGANQKLGLAMMLAAGWPLSQWPALKALWTGESGWNQFAYNASSGATGIPQSLPGNKMASAGADWRTNPATQIRWGLGYIRSVYGSPANAYARWLGRRPHWYDSGGLLPPGTSLVHNGTGRPETIRTARQEAALGGGPWVVINVNGALDPVAVARQIEQLLRQYGRNIGPVQLARRTAAA